MTRVNKKALSVGVLALSMLVAASCGDTIKAKPTYYNDPILNTTTELTHNLMSVLYDALTDNTANKEKVLNAVIDQIALDYFGDYKEAKRLALGGGTDDEVKAFVEKHEFYKQNTNGVEYSNEERILKLQSFVASVEKRITKSYYDEAASGTYSYRSRFSEKKLVQKLRADLYVINDLPAGQNWYNDVLVTENYKTDLTGVIHVNQYEDYTNRYLVKSFYRNLLVEQYMYTNNYSLLGRSYARKVNYVAIPNNSKYPGAARNILTAFADTYIEGDKPLGEVSFDIVTEAWRGINDDGQLSPEAINLLTAAGITSKTITVDFNNVPKTITYYPATKYGDIIEKYAKITEDRNTTENDADFTGSNTYPKEIGYQMKVDELALTDFTTDDWLNKNGATDLPDAIKSRLFNIGVANDVDHIGVTQDSNGNVTEEKKTVAYNSGDYVSKKNGNYWLVPTGTQKVDVNKYNYIILESGTYYMIQVDEAVSTSKLSLTENNNNNYAHLRSGNSLRTEGTLFTDEVAYEIAKLYDANDTYKKNAYSKYIEDSKIMYYDQDIYDYFKEQYPELFD